jgi:hypothetical protein
MADYSISKDPTSTNLTQSKNSSNQVTITKNPGSTKAYFTKSGGTEVAIVKNASAFGPEIVTSSLDFVIGEWPDNTNFVFDDPATGNVSITAAADSNLQGFNSGEVIEGRTYRLQVELFNRSAGSIKPFINGTGAPTVSSDQLIDVEILAGATTSMGIRLRANGGTNTWAVRNISVMEVL